MICDNCSHEKNEHDDVTVCIGIDEYGCPCECNYFFVTDTSELLEELE